jgi:hypothetical protein
MWTSVRAQRYRPAVQLRSQGGQRYSPKGQVLCCATEHISVTC